MADLIDYEWLTGSEAATLLEDVARDTQPIHRQLSRLRKSLSAQRANLVVQQVELRSRAVAKFGNLATKMFFTDVALQQSTDLWTARYKASRIPGGAAVVDFCCGIGGDLIGLAERGPATGWDCDPTIAHFAGANLHAAKLSPVSQVCLGDVESQSPQPSEIWHIDPDRRSDGRRSTQLQFQSPGPSIVERWLETCPNGILKLAPATVVPDVWSTRAELEWVTQNRECRQQIAWFGELASARGQCRATVVSQNPATEAKSFVGLPNLRPPISETARRYVFDTDPSIRAAGLTGALAIDQQLLSINDTNSYLIGDQPVEHPLLSCFEVIEQLPLRASTLSQQLRSLDIGRLEIKKRGVDVDPEQLRKQLKPRGDQAATLLLTRLGTSEIALLAKRLGD